MNDAPRQQPTVTPLDATRSALLRALRPPAPRSHNPGAFPRSTAMRWLTDPRHRWVQGVAVAAGALGVRRLGPLKHARVWLTGLRALRRALDSRSRP